ncbi:MAG: hypothetical protein F6K19_40595 [Cyanothece sp. SIO1E1]|nr:hypothetical protein [Cyanothece sp. SIO1E1]
MTTVTGERLSKLKPKETIKDWLRDRLYEISDAIDQGISHRQIYLDFQTWEDAPKMSQATFNTYLPKIQNELNWVRKRLRELNATLTNGSSFQEIYRSFNKDELPKYLKVKSLRYWVSRLNEEEIEAKKGQPNIVSLLPTPRR